jgi:hypothetical protein
VPGWHQILISFDCFEKQSKEIKWAPKSNRAGGASSVYGAASLDLAW